MFVNIFNKSHPDHIQHWSVRSRKYDLPNVRSRALNEKTGFPRFVISSLRFLVSAKKLFQSLVLRFAPL